MPDSVTAKRQRNTLSFVFCVCVCVSVCACVCVCTCVCVCVCDCPCLLQVEDPRSSLLSPPFSPLTPLSSLTPLLPSLESLVKGSRLDGCVRVQKREGEGERAVEEEYVSLRLSQCPEEEDEVGLYVCIGM